MEKIKKLKPFKKVLSEYVPFVERDPHRTLGEEGSLLLQATKYLITKHEVSQEDRNLAKQTLEILLMYGVDPSVKVKVGKIKVSPLELCEWSNNNKIRDLLLNKSLEASSFEAVAFENKFTDFIKSLKQKIGSKRAAKKEAEAVELGKKVEKDLLNSQVEELMKKGYTKEKAEELLKKKAEDESKVNNLDRKIMKMLDQFDVDSSVKPYLANKISTMIGTSSKAPEVEDQKIQTNKFYVSVSEFRRVVPSGNLTLHFSFLLDKKYGDKLAEVISKHKIGGLDKDPVLFLKELKVIAYFAVDLGSVEPLRSSGKWKSYAGMSKVVKGLEGEKELEKGLTGKQIICKEMKKKELTESDFIKYLSRFFDGDVDLAKKAYSERPSAFRKIIGKTYTRTFKDEKLENLITEDIKDLIKKDDSKRSDDSQSLAVDALMSLGLSRSEAKTLVAGKAGTVEEIVFQALKGSKLKMR